MPNIMTAQAVLGSRRPTEQGGTSAQAAKQDDRGNYGQQHHAPWVPADHPHAPQRNRIAQTAMKAMRAHNGAIRPVGKNQIDIASRPASARPPTT